MDAEDLLGSAGPLPPDLKLADCLEALRRHDASPASTDPSTGPAAPPARIRVLRNFTGEALGPLTRFGCLRRGFDAEVSFGDFDNVAQEVLDPGSPARSGDFDAVVLAFWLDFLAPAWAGGGGGIGCGELLPRSVLEYVSQLVQTLITETPHLVVISTFPRPPFAPQPWGGGEALAGLNRDLFNLGRESGGRVLTLDLAEVVAGAGRATAIDPRHYFKHRAPLATAALLGWADRLAAALAARRGLGRKVLVLDGDNTLWGGIVGEDGPGGIQLDPNDYPGNAYTAFQRQVLELRERGVLLAICSKNNEADVFEVLDTHPACPLSRDDLAAWRINWLPKTENLAALAEELNLGLDSFVLVDDSELECELVRRAFPMVEVLTVPKAVYRLPGLLRDYRGFTPLAATTEDRARTTHYGAERRRAEARASAVSLDDFLASLVLEAEVREPEAAEIPRVTQLFARTNQFNLTTRRYSEGEVAALNDDPDALLLRLAARDRFGDYGISGLTLLRRTAGGGAHLDSFLLSCRVLGRGLEDCLLSEAARRAAEVWGTTRLTAAFRPTAKNGQVADFYPARGFRVAGGADASESENDEKETGAGAGAGAESGDEVSFLLDDLSRLPDCPGFIKVIP